MYQNTIQEMSKIGIDAYLSHLAMYTDLSKKQFENVSNFYNDIFKEMPVNKDFSKLVCENKDFCENLNSTLIKLHVDYMEKLKSGNQDASEYLKGLKESVFFNKNINEIISKNLEFFGNLANAKILVFSDSKELFQKIMEQNKESMSFFKDILEQNIFLSDKDKKEISKRMKLDK